MIAWPLLTHPSESRLSLLELTDHSCWRSSLMVSLPLGGTETLLSHCSYLLMLLISLPLLIFTFQPRIKDITFPPSKHDALDLFSSVSHSAYAALLKTQVQHGTTKSGMILLIVVAFEMKSIHVKNTLKNMRSFSMRSFSIVRLFGGKNCHASRNWLVRCEGRSASCSQVGNATDLQGLEDDGLLDNILTRPVLNVLSAIHDLNIGWTHTDIYIYNYIFPDAWCTIQRTRLELERCVSAAATTTTTLVPVKKSLRVHWEPLCTVPAQQKDGNTSESQGLFCWGKACPSCNSSRNVARFSPTCFAQLSSEAGCRCLRTSWRKEAYSEYSASFQLFLNSPMARKDVRLGKPGIVHAPHIPALSVESIEKGLLLHNVTCDVVLGQQVKAGYFDKGSRC